MHLSLVLAVALCTAPRFESAVHISDRQTVESYVYKRGSSEVRFDVVAP